MPTFRLVTNVIHNQFPKNFKGELTKLISELTGDPETYIHTTSHTSAMAEVDPKVFVGKWVTTSNLGIALLYEQLGSKVEKSDNASIELSQQGGKWVQSKNVGESFNSTNIFESGVEFKDTLLDGRESKSTITLEGNKLTRVDIIGDTKIVTERTFDGDKMSAGVKSVAPDGTELLATAFYNRA